MVSAQVAEHWTTDPREPDFESYPQILFIFTLKINNAASLSFNNPLDVVLLDQKCFIFFNQFIVKLLHCLHSQETSNALIWPTLT